MQPEVGTTAKPRGGGYWRMLVRRERSGDERAIRRVHAAAFRRATAERDSPPEVSLVDNLRASRDWLAKLSLVAMDAEEWSPHLDTDAHGLRGWTASHPCVTAVVALLLARLYSSRCRSRAADALEYLRAQQRRDGSWDAYWWVGRHTRHAERCRRSTPSAAQRRGTGRCDAESRAHRTPTP